MHIKIIHYNNRFVLKGLIKQIIMRAIKKEAFSSIYAMDKIKQTVFDVITFDCAAIASSMAIIKKKMKTQKKKRENFRLCT